jgi:hypothetical protein
MPPKLPPSVNLIYYNDTSSLEFDFQVACRGNAGHALNDTPRIIAANSDLLFLDVNSIRIALSSSRSRAQGKWETHSVFQGGLIAVFSSAPPAGKLCRGPIRKRRVRTLMVVIMAPQGQFAACIGEGEEDFHVQALIAQLAVEALDVAVLDRPPWPDEAVGSGRPDAKGGSGMTQFGRALAELNIEIMCANSSQAKGRVERANRTLQDRLVKELRLAGACDMESGIALLPDSLDRFNERFAIPAASAENVHRKLNVPSSRLNDILCHREQRYVGAQLTFHYGRRQIILNRSELSEELAGKYVEVYDFSDRPLEVRWKGHSLPYRVFDKEQRVNQSAIVENKRLGHALAIVKTQQDITRTTKVMTNSQKGGYKKRGRKVYGPDYYEELLPAQAAVEMPV